MTEEEIQKFSQQYAPVLESMVGLTAQDHRLKFSEALERACKLNGLPIPPKPIQDALLISIFKIQTKGGLPGLPDA